MVLLAKCVNQLLAPVDQLEQDKIPLLEVGVFIMSIDYATVLQLSGMEGYSLDHAHEPQGLKI